MKDMTIDVPGLEKVRGRFLTLLEERQGRIATHALAAWEGGTVEEITGSLTQAKTILHQIAGSAGSLGFPELGRHASHCENAIIQHLDSPEADLPACPGNLISLLDGFATDCNEVMEAARENIFA